jgi:hypothetical protein
MTFTEVLEKLLAPLLAAFLGAVLAFRYQRTTELKKDKRHILQAMMAYRNVTSNELDWIKSLNMIDIVYYDCPKVKELLHKYFAYTKSPLFENGQHIDVIYELLFEMCKSCGYKKLSLADVRDYYAPIALRDHYPNAIKSITPPPETTM